MVRTGVKWGKEGWDFIVRSKEHVERQTWDMYVDEIRREMKEGNTKGWGVEGVVYEEGVRGGYTWMEDDKQEVRSRERRQGGGGRRRNKGNLTHTPSNSPPQCRTRNQIDIRCR